MLDLKTCPTPKDNLLRVSILSPILIFCDKIDLYQESFVEVHVHIDMNICSNILALYPIASEMIFS